jgi:hypothetical protein
MGSTCLYVRRNEDFVHIGRPSSGNLRPTKDTSSSRSPVTASFNGNGAPYWIASISAWPGLHLDALFCLGSSESTQATSAATH